MKSQRWLAITLAVMLGGVVSPAPGCAGEYAESIARAKAALSRQHYPSALTYIRQAHFADLENREPFLLLRQIPALGEYSRSARHYYDMAVAYYLKGDYRNARFFFASAYDLNSGNPGAVPTLVHVDAVLAGRAAPLGDERDLRQLGHGISIETDPVVVGGRRAERIKSGGYTVSHSPEINAILTKYGEPPTDRQSKIDAAWQDVRRQRRMPQTIRSLQMKSPPPAGQLWRP